MSDYVETFQCDACKQEFPVSPIIKRVPIRVKCPGKEEKKQVCGSCFRIIENYLEASIQ